MPLSLALGALLSSSGVTTFVGDGGVITDGVGRASAAPSKPSSLTARSSCGGSTFSKNDHSSIASPPVNRSDNAAAFERSAWGRSSLPVCGSSAAVPCEAALESAPSSSIAPLAAHVALDKRHGVVLPNPVVHVASKIMALDNRVSASPRIFKLGVLAVLAIG